MLLSRGCVPSDLTDAVCCALLACVRAVRQLWRCLCSYLDAVDTAVKERTTGHLPSVFDFVLAELAPAAAKAAKAAAAADSGGRSESKES